MSTYIRNPQRSISSSRPGFINNADGRPQKAAAGTPLLLRLLSYLESKLRLLDVAGVAILLGEPDAGAFQLLLDFGYFDRFHVGGRRL